MALPSILHARRRKPNNDNNGNNEKSSSTTPSSVLSKSKEQLPPPADGQTQKQNTALSSADIKKATKLRRGFAFSASISYLISFVFLILVLIGNTSNKSVLNDLYFFKLNLADIIPTSVPNASLINSIAQSIGLHDFYQVGLWNFCEGYGNRNNLLFPPQTLYWFNPVEILMNELLSGATIALPTQVVTILDVLRFTSQIMFGFFLAGTVVNFLLMLVSPLAMRSRWWSLPVAVVAFLSTLFVLAASIIASVISFVFKYAAEAQSDLNIHAYVGTKMLVFMWVATGFTLWGFVVHAGMGCCCVSRRDLRTGRRVVRNGVVQDVSSSSSSSQHS
ncbi:SUR7/PalI family-domain-containing protein [Bombardia bombarda]|uniref:SUR7/PalI family-domain-containing protein n=1 Tax=Bombardia bombarda TaxID=252184 RepID=A0AA39XLQ8_9PEZI|nr:SUR7/PalI family-domain-containing protein [Bombardia bombarda]